MYKMKGSIVAVMLLCSLHALAVSRAVTYELSPGRFGDNLLSYIHAKWISYKYDLPLLYKPFIYSDRLLLHEKELLYSYAVKNQFDKIVTLGKPVMPKENESHSTLYIVPYFPESRWELHNCLNFQGKPWDYFEIDWDDVNFIAELRKVITPRQAVPTIQMPKNRMSVAVHVRRGGNHDTPDVPEIFTWKFLSDAFFISQIKELYILLSNQPLYVYIFTDDTHPEKIAETFKRSLRDFNIQFDYRMQGNCDTANVIEDFFAMQQFDCLIHSESNFSFIMSKLGDFKVRIYPDLFHKEHGKIAYDHINVIIKN